MSLTFDATNTDYINLGQPSVLNLLPNAEWTLMCWVRKGTTDAFGTFISRADSTGATRQYQFTYGSPGPPYQLQCLVGGVFYVSGVAPPDTDWHHCTLRNINNGGTYQFQMYFNGATAGSVQNSGTGTITCDTLIGARRATGNTGTGFLLTGGITDMRVYNRALTNDEIATIASSQGRDFILLGLVGRWLLNEREPGTVASGSGIHKDISNERNDGTPSGSPTYDSDRWVWVRHKNPIWHM